MSGLERIAFTALSLTPCIASIVGATILALHGQNGWGWLLCIALITASGFEIKTGAKP